MKVTHCENHSNTGWVSTWKMTLWKRNKDVYWEREREREGRYEVGVYGSTD